MLMDNKQQRVIVIKWLLLFEIAFFVPWKFVYFIKAYQLLIMLVEAISSRVAGLHPLANATYKLTSYLTVVQETNNKTYYHLSVIFVFRLCSLLQSLLLFLVSH